jgi:prepilin-type processing-associated H-X9-DG protein
MSTQFRCTACGELFASDAALTGQVPCPRCQALVSVPWSAAQTTAPPAYPPARQGLAIAALVCGIASLVGCYPVGVVALILGIVALVKASARPQEYRGKGMAIAGICTGAVSLLLVPLLISILLPSLSRARELSKRLVCASNLRAIGTSILIYASEQEGQFPNDLQVLVDGGEVMPKQMLCPSSGGNVGDRGWSYVYIPGQTGADDSRNVLAYEKAENHDKEGANVLFLGGHVEFIKPYSRVEQMVAETKQRIAEAKKKQTQEAE